MFIIYYKIYLLTITGCILCTGIQAYFENCFVLILLRKKNDKVIYTSEIQVILMKITLIINCTPFYLVNLKLK